jgi:mono/diheme cytochrome c family protein
VERGRALFLGRADFGAGAPSCISCHTTEGLGSFGGGALGPDLTSAFARLEGRKPLAAWLSAPPSLVMQPVFRNKPLNEEEILALVAYLRSTAESGGRESSGLSLDFLLSGIGGAAVLMVLLDFSWRRRYRAVRRPLVSKD